MIDARISVGLPAHPKTKKLIRRLGEGGAWRLVCLFLWVAQSRPDGDLSGMTGEDIELAADWQGEEGAFIKALIEVGFVDGEEGCYEIHDWEQHNPWAAGASRRSEVARQNALKKWGGGASSENAKTRSQRLAEARAKGKHTKEEWEAMKAVCGDACVKCGATDLDLSKDHIVPICKGGSDGIDNIQPMCHRCNAGKGGSDSADLRPESWSGMLAERLQNACQAHAPSPSPSPSPLPSPNVENLNTSVASAPVGPQATTQQTACPADAIVALYHEILPDNPRCKVLSDARRAAIRARWKEAAKLNCAPFGYSSRADGLVAWRRFFEVCAESDFLTGRAPGLPGKPPFIADIDFLMSPSGFAKTLENKYHREVAA